MADNYLENKFDSYSNGKRVVRKNNPSLDTLLRRNRSYRGYDKSYIVKRVQLERIVSVNSLIPSGRNQQTLRYKLVTFDSGAQSILENIKLGGALPQLQLPFKGTEPEAFIIVCSNSAEDRIVDIDLGISLQSMLLKATEMGLNGIIICAFNKVAIKEAFNLEYEPLAIVAIGKGAEKIELVPIGKEEPHAYYRKDGVHYVPKVRPEDLIL